MLCNESKVTCSRKQFGAFDGVQAHNWPIRSQTLNPLALLEIELEDLIYIIELFTFYHLKEYNVLRSDFTSVCVEDLSVLLTKSNYYGFIVECEEDTQ